MTVIVQYVSFCYQPEAQILRDLTFEAHQGECILIVGRNGVGKSTFLKLLNGILRPASGNILIDGRNSATMSTAELARLVMVTFQNPSDQIFETTVRKEILFGAKNLLRPDPELLTDQALSLFGLEPRAERHPYDLLPAERKLITIASAVAADTPVLAFDEPTTGLSQFERRLVSKALLELLEKGKTLLVATHDLDFFFPLATRIVVLSSGQLVYNGKPTEFMKEPQPLTEWGITLPVAARIAQLLHV